MTIKVKLRELMTSPSNKRRSVIKNNQGDWLNMLLSEIKQYNDWVARCNDSLSKDNNQPATFHEPQIRKCYDW